jgi:acyl carrier protein
MATTTEAVLAILAAHTKRDISAISPDTPLVDLGVDSLDVMEITFAIEEKYDIDLPLEANDETGGGVVTIGDLARMVDGRIGRPQAKVA